MKWKDDNRPAKNGWAPGGYLCWCAGGCGQGFVGAKQCMTCADCAYALPDPAPPAPRPMLVEERLSSQVAILSEAVQGAIDELTSWFLDNTNRNKDDEHEGFEDYDPVIDEVRSALQDALRKAAEGK